MKIFRSVILGIIALYFQLLIAPKFALFGIIPNFLLAFVIFTTIKIGLQPTLSIAFFLGLAFDLLSPNLLGMNTLSFIIVAFVVGNFHESVNKTRFTIVAISIIFVNFFFYFIQILYFLVSRQSETGMFRLLLFSIFYNSFITICTVYVLVIVNRLKLIIDV